MEEVTPVLLNSLSTQLFFFSCLRIEEYLCTASLFYSLLFVSIIPLELTVIAGNVIVTILIFGTF